MNYLPDEILMTIFSYCPLNILYKEIIISCSGFCNILISKIFIWNFLSHNDIWILLLISISNNNINIIKNIINTGNKKEMLYPDEYNKAFRYAGAYGRLNVLKDLISLYDPIIDPSDYNNYTLQYDIIRNRHFEIAEYINSLKNIKK